MEDEVMESVVHDLHSEEFIEVLVTVHSVKDFIKKFREKHSKDLPKGVRVDSNTISHGDTRVRVFSLRMGMEGLRGTLHDKHYSTVELSEDWSRLVKSRKT